MAASKNIRKPTPTEPPFLLMPLGDSALTVEFGNAIDPEISARVITFTVKVRAQAWDGLLDVVPTYRSATIHFDPLCLDMDRMIELVLNIDRTVIQKTAPSGTLHMIPVCFGGEYGPDLEDVAAFGGLSSADAIRLLASITYRLYMLGFSPGFPYLGSVPAQLAMPRLQTPRTTVPPGSVGIAERQTGIYPIETPGGWRIIGRTPLQLYRPTGAHPFLLNPGDSVQFKPIEPDEFDRLQQEHGRD
jgi:inhibitor of KinA